MVQLVQLFSVFLFKLKLNLKSFFLFHFFKVIFTSKLNGTPKGVYLPISKLHSILAVANLLAHNNKTIRVNFNVASK